METYNADKKGLSGALTTLRNGGLVVCPSDTVYGLLVDAKNEKAVNKLITFKNRPPGKPISVFLPGKESLDTYVSADHNQKKILDQLIPGPFTIILPSRHAVAPGLESEKGTLGIRIPDHTFINDLLRSYGSPLTATSANLSGRPAHYSVETLLDELPDSKRKLIDAVVDAGKLPRNKPSTIIDLTDSRIKIVRHGDIVAKDTQTFETNSSSDTGKTARFIVRHYINDTPRKPLIFILEGDMGVGKTIFVKGAASLFGIDTIISPTFVVSYEYDIHHGGLKKLVHADLFNVEDTEEFAHLGLQAYLQPGCILFIEWGEKAGGLYQLLKEKAMVIHILMKYLSPERREIIVQESA